MNEVSGMKLLTWSLYYLSLSYTVIIYDRYAAHKSFILPLIHIDKFSEKLLYYPYTIFEKFNPSKYNPTERTKQVIQF